MMRNGEFPFILHGFMLFYWCSDMSLQTVFIRGEILVLNLKKVTTKEKRPDTTPASIENKRSKNFLFNAA
jgi:hypothetical protein